MNIKTLIATGLVAACGLASSSAMAFQCGALSVSDSVATSILNSQVKGVSYKISSLKKLVIKGAKSATATDCHMRATLNVTLERKLRQDAKGTMTVKGDLAIRNNKMCLANVYVLDFDLSHTLGIGEEAYKIVANRAMPSTLCF